MSALQIVVIAPLAMLVGYSRAVVDFQRKGRKGASIFEKMSERGQTHAQTPSKSDPGPQSVHPAAAEIAAEDSDHDDGHDTEDLDEFMRGGH